MCYFFAEYLYVDSGSSLRVPASPEAFTGRLTVLLNPCTTGLEIAPAFSQGSIWHIQIIALLSSYKTFPQAFFLSMSLLFGHSPTFIVLFFIPFSNFASFMSTYTNHLNLLLHRLIYSILGVFLFFSINYLSRLHPGYCHYL